MRIAIVGSGLSALGTATALSDMGLGFDVVDAGLPLPSSLLREKARRARIPVALWGPNERDWLISSVRTGLFVDKTVFGTQTFFSRAFPLDGRSDDEFAPASSSPGGMASGWGASALPLSYGEIKLWGNLSEELWAGYERILELYPYSFSDDSLSQEYSAFGRNPDSFLAQPKSDAFISRICSASNRYGAIAGRARLMIRTGDSGCLSCGECNSGCVFDHIFNPYSDLKRLTQESGGRFFGAHKVEKIEREKSAKHLLCKTGESNLILGPYDTIILASGPLPTLEIITRSGFCFDKLILESRSGYIFGGFDLYSVGWNASSNPGTKTPNNTLATAFIESSQGFENRIHTQVSARNELVEKKLRSLLGSSSVLDWAISRLRYFFINYTGTWSTKYLITRDYKTATGLGVTKIAPRIGYQTAFNVLLHHIKIALRAGVVPLPKLFSNNGSYHVGSLRDLDGVPVTDDNGRVKGLEGVLVVDTSTFPFLPASTIGLTAMANAYAIAVKNFSDGTPR